MWRTPRIIRGLPLARRVRTSLSFSGLTPKSKVMRIKHLLFEYLAKSKREKLSLESKSIEKPNSKKCSRSSPKAYGETLHSEKKLGCKKKIIKLLKQEVALVLGSISLLTESTNKHVASMSRGDTAN